MIERRVIVSLGHRHEKTAISVTERAYVPTGRKFNAVRYDQARSRQFLEPREKVFREYRMRQAGARSGRPSRILRWRGARSPGPTRRRGEEQDLPDAKARDHSATGRHPRRARHPER
jgi:hypothetical protein